MSWLYGIPDVSFTNHFVYFKDLLETNYSNTYSGYSRKQQVGYQALSAYNENIRQLGEAQIQIEEAIDFIRKVAQSERQKELDAVNAYYRKINGKELDLNKDDILTDPENFYTKLTKAINEARLGIEGAKQELIRIKNNSEGAKKNLSDYFKNDFRYRLNSDITSLLKKMIGTYVENDKSANTFNQKVQEMALDIVNETVDPRIKNGEDYAAIAVAVLVDIEREAQKILDDPKYELNDFTQLSDEILATLKKDYLTRAEKGESNAIVDALQGNSDEFLRITNNVKKILGITTLDKESKEYQKQKDLIAKQASRRNKDSQNARKAVSNIQRKLKRKQKESLHSLDFTSKSDFKNSAHGKINELIQSLLDENGIKAGETAAADLLSIQCGWEIKPNNSFINEIMNTIGEEMSKVITLDKREDDANIKDLRGKISKMNENIDASIKILDDKLHELNENTEGEFFIFHESLKLYSSMETGVYKNWGGHAGFGGRTMNILTYIDFLLSATQEAGIDIPADRDLLIFLGLNLSKEAIGEGASEPLVRYFSIFAGLLMFDDVVGMAREALEEMPKSTIKQVHLYNLNGIYVPSSMILSYVGDALTAGAQEVSYGATATIQTNEAEKAINDWHLKYSKENFHPILGPREWNEMGAKVASGTKVKIAFMASFLRFINKIAEIS